VRHIQGVYHTGRHRGIYQGVYHTGRHREGIYTRVHREAGRHGGYIHQGTQGGREALGSLFTVIPGLERLSGASLRLFPG